MIGFPDINEDLFRVEEIINRDRVEARLEFLEEKEFNKQQKNLDEAENETRAHEQDAMPAGRKSVARDDQKPREQRNRFDDPNKKVAMKAAQKSVEDISGRESSGFERNEQDDAQYGPGDNQENAPERGKAIARACPSEWLRHILVGH